MVWDIFRGGIISVEGRNFDKRIKRNSELRERMKMKNEKT